MTRFDVKAFLDHLQLFGIKLGLDNINLLLDGFGRPEKKFPTIHIAGTNGKGSVAAMLASILQANGWKTGLYTSPHLARVEERIRINGLLISARRFSLLAEKARAIIDELMSKNRLIYYPTYFEVLTAMAFDYFDEEKVDIAVIEVGMGGRFDATNVITPLASVITTISKDHEKYLGSTIRKIAFEKAGIIKKKVPVICGVREPAALDVIKKRARKLDAPFINVFGPGRKLTCRLLAGRYSFSYAMGSRKYSFSPGLAGKFQGENAATAIVAAQVLSKFWHSLRDEAIIEGIEKTRWEGRLETVSFNPLVILDGAHNEAGARVLSEHIQKVIRRPVVLVFAVMKDKDISGMARHLFGLARTVILTRVSDERASQPEEIIKITAGLANKVIMEPQPGKAVRAALAESDGQAPIVITGSLYLIGEIKKLKIFRALKAAA